MFKLCTKFERNRTIHSWLIDDLANRYARDFNGRQCWRHETQELGATCINLRSQCDFQIFDALTPPWKKGRVREKSVLEQRLIIAAQGGSIRFLIHCIVSKDQTWRRNFGLLTPWKKLGEGWSNCVSEFYEFGLGPNLRYTFDRALPRPSGRVERGIKKDTGKHKGLPTYVVRH